MWTLQGTLVLNSADSDVQIAFGHISGELFQVSDREISTNIGLTIPGNWSFEIDFTREIRRISWMWAFGWWSKYRSFFRKTKKRRNRLNGINNVVCRLESTACISSIEKNEQYLSGIGQLFYCLEWIWLTCPWINLKPILE